MIIPDFSILHDFRSFQLALSLEVDAGRVLVDKHPTEDLWIYHYSRDCQCDNLWNSVNIFARGLVLSKDGIVALPFPKFFNFGEISFDLPQNEKFEVFEKMDGSLGIVFWWAGKWHVATKGSFTSEQCVWAQKWLDGRVWPTALNPSFTYLVEIIYPENRVIIPYKKEDSGLYLLGIYDRQNCCEVYDEHNYGQAVIGLNAPRAQQHTFESIESILELSKTLPPNREGFVVRFESGFRLKIKGAEYVRYHKIKEKFSKKYVWECLRASMNMDALRKELPEEFLPEYDESVRKFTEAYQAAVSKIMNVSADLNSRFPTMKELGLYEKTVSDPDEKVLFNYLYLLRKNGNTINERMKESIFDHFINYK